MTTFSISMSQSAWITTLRRALSEAEHPDSHFEFIIEGSSNEIPSQPIEIRLDNDDMEDRDDLPDGACFVDQL